MKKTQYKRCWYMKFSERMIIMSRNLKYYMYLVFLLIYSVPSRRSRKGDQKSQKGEQIVCK